MRCYSNRTAARYGRTAPVPDGRSWRPRKWGMWLCRPGCPSDCRSRARRTGETSQLVFSLISYFLVSDDDRLDTGNLGFLLAKASQRWNDLLAERFAEHGFSEVRTSYGSVLLPLFEEDGLRMGQIAERARLSKQTMTTLVRLCERDGLVVRQRDARDARSFRIKLTKRAKDFRPVAGQILRELDQKMLAVLGERQTAALRRALKGVMDL